MRERERGREKEREGERQGEKREGGSERWKRERDKERAWDSLGVAKAEPELYWPSTMYFMLLETRFRRTKSRTSHI